MKKLITAPSPLPLTKEAIEKIKCKGKCNACKCKTNKNR